MSDDPVLSIVVPCYNEELVIHELLARVRSVCAAEDIADYELILVDDGSSDRTTELIEAANREDARVVGVVLSRNHGHQLALSAGLSFVRGARILVLDADLQDPPELLPDMMRLMDEGYDVVFGQRRKREGETRFKRLSAHIFYQILHRIVDIDLPVDTGDFRLMSRRVSDVLIAMPEKDRFIRGMVSWIGFKQTAVLYDRDPRFAGETKYPFSKMLKLAADAFTGFSIRPLRLATYAGFAIGAFALLVGLRVLFGYFAGNTVPGWTSLMLVVSIIGAMQMFVIGIMGEYIGRLYMQSKDRPVFLVDRIIARDVESERSVHPVPLPRATPVQPRG